MGGNYTYALEKLRSAVYYLAIGEEDVRSRLLTAYNETSPLRHEDFPEHLRAEWQSINARLTSHPEDYSGQGTVPATLSHMDNSTGAEIARSLFELRDKLESWLHRDRTGGKDVG